MNSTDKTKQSTIIPSTRNRNNTLSIRTQSTSSDVFDSSLNTDENNFKTQKQKKNQKRTLSSPKTDVHEPKKK